MLNEKKTAVTEEAKEEVRKLTEEELEQVTGGGAVAVPGGGAVAVPGGGASQLSGAVIHKNPLGAQVDPTEPPSPVAGSVKTGFVEAATQNW